MCETGKLFFEEAGTKMYLSRGEEEKYFLTETGEDGETLYRDGIHVNRLMRKLRSLDHGTKEYFTPTLEQMDVIAEKFPWLGRYDIEIGNSLKKHLTALLCFAIGEGDDFLIQSILEKYHFDRESLDRRVIRDIKKIEVMRVDRYQKMIVKIQPAGEDHLTAGYICGDNCLTGDDWLARYRMRRYLSTEASRKLMEAYREKLSLIEDARNERNGFRKADYPHGFLCYRPLPKESAGRPGRYESIFIGHDGTVSFQDFYGLCHSILNCDIADIKEEKARHAEMITAGTEPLYQTAVRNGDVYLMYAMKEETGLITEDECEYMSKTDGLLHTVARRTSETASSVTVKEAEFRHPTFFSRMSRYSCRVDINGTEYQTTWEPARPGSITVLKYHHYAEIHLTEKQIREFWEKTDANPESNPIGRPKTWTSKL